MAQIAIVRGCVVGTALAAIAVLSAASAVWAANTAVTAEDEAVDGVDADSPFGDADSNATSWHVKTNVDAEPAGESWIGGEGYRRAASLYSGVTWAPFSNLRQDGARVRIVTGQSFYHYAGRRYDASTDTNVWEKFVGLGRFMDVMAGWQFSGNGTTVKVFAGNGTTSHLIAPFDPETQIQGRARGLKGAVEIWHNWSSTRWTSLDVSVARAHSTYSAQTRSGWRVDPEWSLGPEASMVGHSEGMVLRAGVFARYETLTHEFTLSGGVARARGDTPMGYGTAQYLKRF